MLGKLLFLNLLILRNNIFRIANTSETRNNLQAIIKKDLSGKLHRFQTKFGLIKMGITSQYFLDLWMWHRGGYFDVGRYFFLWQLWRRHTPNCACQTFLKRWVIICGFKRYLPGPTKGLRIMVLGGLINLTLGGLQELQVTAHMKSYRVDTSPKYTEYILHTKLIFVEPVRMGVMGAATLINYGQLVHTPVTFLT